MNREEILAYKKPATVLTIALLLLAIFDLPYGYYVFLRWEVSLASAFLAYLMYDFKKTFWTVIFCATAILFNPIVPIYLSKDVWQVLDLVVATIFGFSFFTFKDKQ